MSPEERTKSEDLWSSYKDLKHMVWQYLNQETSQYSSTEFENTLRKYKQNFFTLLQNQPKSAKSRETLKQGTKDGINIKGLGHQVLCNELYEEAIILSDMYDMNELIALDLLCTAQIEMPYFPGLARGLVAVLLYYEGRKSLLTTLRYLVQARTGIQWSLNIKPETEKFITNYTDQLLEGGLFTRILELLRTLDLSKELELLQTNLAIGGAKHRRQIIDLFDEIRFILADIIFTWSTQSGLPKQILIALLQYVKRIDLGSADSSGQLDTVNLYLVMAVLASLDLSILHTREDTDDVVQKLPILADGTYLETILQELNPSTGEEWKNPGVKAVIYLGVGVCLTAMQNQRTEHILLQPDVEYVEVAVEGGVFEYLHNTIMENEQFFKDNFIVKRLHNLLADFVMFLYPNVKEMRIRADEIARTIQSYVREGLEVPIQRPKDFEYLQLTIGKLYLKSPDRDLCVEYWCPSELVPQQQIRTTSPRSTSLFKFVRLANDQVPPPLFVPYLTMLAGISSGPQAARYCFNMLKQAPQGTTLSWNHFFLSFAQYFNNLRQENPAPDTIYTRSTYLKGVNPQELNGLHAVLLLVRTIATYDENSRIAFGEHPVWSLFTCFLGLITCPIPIALKSDLVLTLAQLAKSSESAATLWDNLEASQIIVTIVPTSYYQPRGLESELEEYESRLEEYPLTRSVLQLLNSLIEFGVPKTLGAGQRQPGFDPYFTFLIQSVFLKYQTRAYKERWEKWQVGDDCLKLFETFLTQYEPQSSDFQRNQNAVPPGYHLMVQLNTKSETLNTLLELIDEGTRLFDTFSTFKRSDIVQDCTRRALNVLDCALNLQMPFIHAAAQSNSTIILTGLSKLLLSYNSRSGRPDYCINIAKYLTYQPYLQRHSLIAVKILKHLTASTVLHGQFMSALLTSPLRNTIAHGFVENLDNDQEVLIDNEDVTNETKIMILKLLKQCVNYRTPNFTQFLMGFDLKHDIAQTIFQYSGVLDTPRTCLHSICTILETVRIQNVNCEVLLLENVYELVFHLVSNCKTSKSVLRFFRLNPRFFQQHLNGCTAQYAHAPTSINVLNQFAWLMKIVAVELKICSQTKQLTYVKTLTNFLLNVPRMERDSNQEPFSTTAPKSIESEQKFRFVQNDFVSDGTSSFMMYLIGSFNFASIDFDGAAKTDSVQWQYFHRKALEDRIKSCETLVLNEDTKLIDIVKLHQILCNEMKQLHGANSSTTSNTSTTGAIGQIQLISQEVPKILKYALELNKCKERHAAIVNFLDGWRQIIEVVLYFVPPEVLPLNDLQVVAITTILKVLQAIDKVEISPRIGQILSGLILMILHRMKSWLHTHYTCDKLAETSYFQTHLTSFKSILDHLLQWLITSNVTDEILRINLYAILATFLQISTFTTLDLGALKQDTVFLNRLDSAQKRASIPGSGLLSVTMECFAKVGGDRLIEIINQDCVGGPESSRLLALCTLSHVIHAHADYKWIAFMSGRGHLKCLIETLPNDDLQLIQLLESGNDTVMQHLRHLYAYLAKILLLIRLAGTKIGAELVLEHKLLTYLGEMSVFSYHPEITNDQVPPDNFSTEFMYLQIWLPALELCNALLTTLGTENHSASEQILIFLLQHGDIVDMILRAGAPFLHSVNLRELSLLSSVICRTVSNNCYVELMSNVQIAQNSRQQLFRIQKLMLQLLVKFLLTDGVVRDLTTNSLMLSTTAQALSADTSDRVLYVMQIMANLLSYARNLIRISISDSNPDTVLLLFQPTLIDLIQYDNSKANHTFAQYQSQMSLGIIVQQLIYTVNYHHQEKATFYLLVKRVEDVSSMDNAQLDEYVTESLKSQDISQKRDFVFGHLARLLHRKRTELNYTHFIIENCLYLTWLHLDYYMLKAVPRLSAFEGVPPNSQQGILPPAAEATWKVSTDDLSKLKHGLVSIFNDSFTKKLTAIFEDKPELDKSFVDSLMRKILRLIQFVPVK